MHNMSKHSIWHRCISNHGQCLLPATKCCINSSFESSLHAGKLMNAPCDSAPNVPCGCTLLSALTVSLCNFLSYAMTWQKQAWRQKHSLILTSIGEKIVEYNGNAHVNNPQAHVAHSPVAHTITCIIQAQTSCMTAHSKFAIQGKAACCRTGTRTS